MPDVHHADATGEVEVRRAVHIGDARARRGGGEDVMIGIDAARQVAFAVGLDRLGMRLRLLRMIAVGAILLRVVLAPCFVISTSFDHLALYCIPIGP